MQLAQDLLITKRTPRKRALKGIGRSKVKHLLWAKEFVSEKRNFIGDKDIDPLNKTVCICYGCGRVLIPVLRGTAKKQGGCTPHFRHPKGSDGNHCSSKGARGIIKQAFSEGNTLTFPLHNMPDAVEELRGEFEGAWIAPRERAKVACVEYSDEVNLVLTLSDGRKVKVDLSGAVEPPFDMATIRLFVDGVDLSLVSALKPDELSDLIDKAMQKGEWLCHWSDQTSDEDLLLQMPWLGGVGNLETRLHRKAKEIIVANGGILLPPLSVPGGASTKERLVHFTKAEAEAPIGKIRPDVLVTLKGTRFWESYPLIIEITVTHGVDPMKLAVIKELNVAALEVDISRFGGFGTEEDFKKLILDEVAGKNWLFHPWIEKQKINTATL